MKIANKIRRFSDWKCLFRAQRVTSLGTWNTSYHRVRAIMYVRSYHRVRTIMYVPVRVRTSPPPDCKDRTARYSRGQAKERRIDRAKRQKLMIHAESQASRVCQHARSHSTAYRSCCTSKDYCLRYTRECCPGMYSKVHTYSSSLGHVPLYTHCRMAEI